MKKFLIDFIESNIDKSAQSIFEVTFLIARIWPDLLRWPRRNENQQDKPALGVLTYLIKNYISKTTKDLGRYASKFSSFNNAHLFVRRLVFSFKENVFLINILEIFRFLVDFASGILRNSV